MVNLLDQFNTFGNSVGYIDVLEVNEEMLSKI